MDDEQSKEMVAVELALTDKDFGMIAMELARTGKCFDANLSLDNNKEAVQLFLTMIGGEVVAEERGGTVYLSFDAGPFRAVQVDRPESNSRQVQYLMVVASLDPLCSNLENHAVEAGSTDLVVLLLAA